MRLATKEEAGGLLELIFARTVIVEPLDVFRTVATKDPCVWGSAAYRECAVWKSLDKQFRQEWIYYPADEFITMFRKYPNH